MLKFVVDENFNMQIINGVLRRISDIDIITIKGTELEGAKDRDLLEWAAKENRVLLTHDVNTLTAYAYERVVMKKPMPGYLKFN